MNSKILFLILLVAAFFCGNGADALTVSPPRFEVNLNPGESADFEAMVFNEETQDLRLNSHVEMFKPKGERGEVEIVPDVSAFQSVSWVDVKTKDAIIKPGETKKMPFSVNAPKGATPGGYYLALFWEAKPYAAEGNNPTIAITSRIGSLIFINIKGEQKQILELADFSFSRSSMVFSSKIKNSGNVHLAPAGRVIIRNMFGQVADSLAFNPTGNYVMPNSDRVFDTIWNIRPLGNGFFGELVAEWKTRRLGYYKARLDMTYGDNQQVFSREAGIWVIPYRTILFVIIVAAGFWLIMRKKQKLI